MMRSLQRFLKIGNGAQRWRERGGEGSKLGNKLTNPARFCNIDFFADDPDTRNLLVHDKEIGAACTRCYSSFLDLAAKLSEARARSGVVLEEALNFTIGVRLQYSGMTLSEIADEFHTMLRSARVETVKPPSDSAEE
jgi:hypothetical protein